MRFTSRKDMMTGLALASGLLCFQLGATFGVDPPGEFYAGLMGAPGAPSPRIRPGVAVAPTAQASGLTATPVSAAFIDQQATIRSVRLTPNGAGTRVEITLSPGAAAPRLTMLTRNRRSTLAVSGLNATNAGRGDGLGLVNRWELRTAAEGARLNLPLAEPAVVQRAFLSNESGDDRRLVLDLVRACPTRS